MNATEYVTLLEAAGVEDLDELVHEAKGEEAAGINNGGLDRQVDFLLAEGYRERLDSMLEPRETVDGSTELRIGQAVNEPREEVAGNVVASEDRGAAAISLLHRFLDLADRSDDAWNGSRTLDDLLVDAREFVDGTTSSRRPYPGDPQCPDCHILLRHVESIPVSRPFHGIDEGTGAVQFEGLIDRHFDEAGTDERLECPNCLAEFEAPEQVVFV